MPVALFIEISNCCVADFLQSQYSATQFTEEFDFTAMNEKFKKDEVWGYLGKGKDKTGGVQGFTTGQSLGEREGHGLIPNPKVGLATFL